MATLEGIFASNLRSIRGDRTQAEMAEFLGLPLRSYQNLEYGKAMPQQETRELISEKCQIPEGRLFADPDYVATPDEALEILKKALENRRSLESSPTKRAALAIIESLDEDGAQVALELLKTVPEALADLVADGAEEPAKRGRKKG